MQDEKHCEMVNTISILAPAGKPGNTWLDGIAIATRLAKRRGKCRYMKYDENERRQVLRAVTAKPHKIARWLLSHQLGNLISLQFGEG
jgi:hypothetical protein